MSRHEPNTVGRHAVVPAWPRVPVRLTAGYGVASGRAADSPYPAGTIVLQAPYFAERGLDLTGFYPGTLNLDAAPFRFEPIRPRFSAEINWHADITERFSFFDAVLDLDDRQVSGLLYYPHPETKPAHQQPGSVIEMLAPWIEGLAGSASLRLAADPAQAVFRHA